MPPLLQGGGGRGRRVGKKLRIKRIGQSAIYCISNMDTGKKGGSFYGKESERETGSREQGEGNEYMGVVVVIICCITKQVDSLEEAEH